MRESAIEERLANLERQVAELQQNQPVKKPWGVSTLPPMSPELLEAHRAMEAYGRYWRKTGKEAPDDWKPGDPIPEPVWDVEE